MTSYSKARQLGIKKGCKLKLANQKPTDKDLDALFREVIRLRDRVCQRTGSPDRLQVAHFISRSNHHVRWDLDNACLLTAGEHLTWAHKSPGEFTFWWGKRLGAKRFDDLHMRARDTSKIDRWAVKLYLIAAKRKLSAGEAI